MKTYQAHIGFTILSSLCLVVLNESFAQDATKAALQAIEPKLRAIYEEGAFRAKPFRAEWLPDSSGYLVPERIEGTSRSTWVRYAVKSGKRTEGTPGERERDRSNRSPNGELGVFTAGGNLHVRDVKSGRTKQLTLESPESAISYSRATWSPDGERIAFVQSDRSEVRLRSMLIPSDPSYPEVRETRFARVGEAITKLKVGVVKVDNGTTQWLPIPTPSEGIYLGQIEWAGNSDELLVERLSRFRNEREFLLVDIRTNSIRTLFRESDPAWVIASYRKNAGLEWIREGRAFIVISEKDGWRHAYIYSREGEEVIRLTPGRYDIIDRVKIDEERGWFYFAASPYHGAQKYLYRVPLAGGAAAELVSPANQVGTHDYDFSPDGRWAFHTYSSFDSPPKVELVELPQHRVIRQLEDNRELRQKMKREISQPTEFLQLNIGDGVEMDAWLLKPSNFDPSLKYPVLVYVYGEPHAQTVLDAWGRVHADYHRAIADLGYLVVSIDNRGTPAPKGAAWRRAVLVA